MQGHKSCKPHGDLFHARTKPGSDQSAWGGSLALVVALVAVVAVAAEAAMAAAA